MTCCADLSYGSKSGREHDLDVCTCYVDPSMGPVFWKHAVKVDVGLCRHLQLLVDYNSLQKCKFLEVFPIYAFSYRLVCWSVRLLVGPCSNRKHLLNVHPYLYLLSTEIEPNEMLRHLLLIVGHL